MKRTERRGYSLIEVLWVMALIAFLLAGLGDLLLESFRAGRRAEETALKTSLLASTLEGFKTLPFADPALAPGDYASDARLCDGGKPARLEWRIGADDGGLKRVDCSLFLAGEQERALVSALLISEALGF